jgi:hypothetical protein
VDDQVAILSGGVEVFSHDFSTGGLPQPAIVPVPRALLEPLAGESVRIEYRDVYGVSVGASPLWLIWLP